VDGHAKGNKNTPYLQKLSIKRAVAVKDELARQGVRADHIKHKGSGAAGRGMHVFIMVDHIGARAARLYPFDSLTSIRSFADQLAKYIVCVQMRASVHRTSKSAMTWAASLLTKNWSAATMASWKSISILYHRSL
jgi:hypothetical protein